MGEVASGVPFERAPSQIEDESPEITTTNLRLEKERSCSVESSGGLEGPSCDITWLEFQDIAAKQISI